MYSQTERGRGLDPIILMYSLADVQLDFILPGLLAPVFSCANIERICVFVLMHMVSIKE